MRKWTEKYIETKEEIKNLAIEIKLLKAAVKEAQRNNKCAIGPIDKLNGAKRRFVVLHVAMSLYRGRTIDQIFAYGEETDYDRSGVEKKLEELNKALEDERIKMEAADAA